MKTTLFILAICSFIVGTISYPPIISRSGWGAKPPKSISQLKHPVPIVVIHHTFVPPICNTTCECIYSMQTMQKFHVEVNKWDDIGYNFLVGGDGNIYEGRGWNRVGAHARIYNNVSIGISLIGDFRETLPYNSMIQRAHELIQLGLDLNFIQRNYTLVGHRAVVTNTECPGNAFYETLKTWPHWQPYVKI